MTGTGWKGSINFTRMAEELPWGPSLEGVAGRMAGEEGDVMGGTLREWCRCEHTDQYMRSRQAGLLAHRNVCVCVCACMHVFVLVYVGVCMHFAHVHVCLHVLCVM